MTTCTPGPHRELFRFLLVGGANTGLTTAAFYALSYILPTWVAFTVVYLGGLALVVVVVPGFVFRSQPAPARRGGLAGWYLCVYGVGLVMIRLLGHVVGSHRLAITLATVAVTAPLTFVGARFLVGRSVRQVESGTGPSSPIGGNTPSG